MHVPYCRCIQSKISPNLTGKLCLQSGTWCVSYMRWIATIRYQQLGVYILSRISQLCGTKTDFGDFPWLSSGACHFDFGDFTEKWATVTEMNRYLKYVLCQYPYICGQVYTSSQGLAIQTMWNNGYVIFLDCRAMQLKLNRGGCGTRLYRYSTGQYTHPVTVWDMYQTYITVM